MDLLARLGAQYLIVVPVLLFVGAMLSASSNARKEVALRAAVAGMVALILAKVCGALVYDPRPFMVLHRTPLVPHAAEGGLPSDHALLAFTLAFACLPISRPLAAVAFLSATLLGAARVACLLHSPLQIAAGAAMAAVGFFFAQAACARLASRSFSQS